MCSSNLLKAGNPCKLTFSRSCSDYDKMFKGTNARRMNVFARVNIAYNRSILLLIFARRSLNLLNAL